MAGSRVERLGLRVRRCAAMCLVGLCGASLGSHSLAEDRPNAEARLEAVRNALVDQALEAPVQVRSAAWIDESGRLHESTQIRANLRVRGVRVESYLEEGAPPTPPGTAQKEASPPPVAAASDAECRQSHGRYRRHAALLDNPLQAAVVGYHFLPELVAHARQTLLSGFAAQEGWVVTPVVAAGSAWERTLTDAGNANAAPYLIQLRVEPQSPDASQSARGKAELPEAVRATLGRLGLSDDRLPERPVRLSLQIIERASGRQLWADAVLIEYPRAEVTFARPPLPQPMLASVAQVVQAWRESLTKALACEPLRFAVSAAGDGQYALEAGTQEGLRVGDQFLLVDSARFPARILEPGTASRPTLIEVKSVSAQRAFARLVAGPPPPAPLQAVLAQPF